jgi:hypothetical protein
MTPAVAAPGGDLIVGEAVIGLIGLLLLCPAFPLLPN